jgi:hypothetical protein
MLTRRTAPADSATKREDTGDLGSGTAAKSLDFRTMGLPYLLPALAARRCRFSCSALWDIGQPGVHQGCPFSTHSVSKKCSGLADCIVEDYDAKIKDL